VLRYLFVTAHGNLSLVELIFKLADLDLKIKEISPCVYEITFSSAGSLEKRLHKSFRLLGGTNKVAEIFATVRNMKEAEPKLSEMLSDVVANEKIPWTTSVCTGDSSYGESIIVVVSNMIRVILTSFGIRKSVYNMPEKSLICETNQVIECPSSKVQEILRLGGFEIILASTSYGETILSKTFLTADHTNFRKRDLERPAQNPTQTMPPRLARLLVNLAGVKPSSVLLDPFCVYGTLLMEAAVSGANVIGVDKNPKMVKATLANLSWLERSYKLQNFRYRVMGGDATVLSKIIERNSVDGIATEPVLLPVFREKPGIAHAEFLVEKAQDLQRVYFGSPFCPEEEREARNCCSFHKRLWQGSFFLDCEIL
jgi:hypothetical protein